MLVMLRLTWARGPIPGTPFFLNAADIEYFYRQGEETIIFVKNKPTAFSVVEDIDAILLQIPDPHG